MQENTQLFKNNAICLKTLNIILFLWTAFLIIYYRNFFGGDPEIHLIFAKNFLQGHFLEFNPGYKTGGETSPLYMLIVACIYFIMGDYTQYGMKFISICSLGLIAYFLYKSTDSQELQRKLFGVITFTSMTFIPFHTMIGMENILFASAILTIVYFFERGRIEKILLIAVPMCFLLRPETIFLSIYIFLKGLKDRNVRHIIIALIAISTCFILYQTLNIYSGIDTHNAGSVRILLSKIDSFVLNIGSLTIYISKKPFIGFVYIWLLLTIIVLKSDLITKNDLVLLVSFFVLPATLHILNILPNAHFSRYVIYIYVIFFYLFCNRVLPLLSTRSILVTGTIFLCLAIVEFKQRKSLAFYSVHQSIESMKPENIKMYSDFLFTRLQENQHPSIVLASTEVQLRGTVDNRFIVWSLDGITDAHMKTFANEVKFDHFAYIKYRNIRYLTDIPDYNIDKSQQSLSDFQFDKNGNSQCINGISLSKLTDVGLYKISTCNGE